MNKFASLSAALLFAVAGAALGSGGASEPGDQRQCRHQGRDQLVHHPVTLCGSGLVLSRAVYHGISRKKRK